MKFNEFGRTGMSVSDKLVRYSFMAGVAAIVDVGGFALLCLTPIPIAVSAATSFCLATVVKFPLTCRYVFNHEPTLRGFGLFFVAAVGGLLVNVSVTVGQPVLGYRACVCKDRRHRDRISAQFLGQSANSIPHAPMLGSYQWRCSIGTVLPGWPRFR
jgi:putative flippase GtrA